MNDGSSSMMMDKVMAAIADGVGCFIRRGWRFDKIISQASMNSSVDYAYK